MIVPVNVDGKQLLAVTLEYKCIEDVHLVRESLINITKTALLNDSGLKSGFFNGGELIDVMDLIESMGHEITNSEGGVATT